MKSSIAAGTFRPGQVITFIFPNEQADAETNNYELQDEIELNGKMYDVVSARQEGNEMIIQVICDDDETLLVHNYQQLMAGKKQSLPDKDITCLKGFFSPFLVSSYPFVSHPEIQKKKSRLLYDSTAFLLRLTSKVLKPPPRCV